VESKPKGLRGENGAVNCRTRSGRTQNQAKRGRVRLLVEKLSFERLEEIDALWTQDRRNFGANDRSLFQWCVCPGTIASNVDNGAEMKFVGYPDKDKITTLAVFLNLFHNR
jgi:hypothetical protein